MCSADEQPCVEEKQKRIRQAAAESTEAGPLGEALQCCPSSWALANAASQLDLCLQSAQNKFDQEHCQVLHQPVLLLQSHTLSHEPNSAASFRMHTTTLVLYAHSYAQSLLADMGDLCPSCT